MNKFQCADFEIAEIDNINSIKKSFEFNPINSINQKKENNDDDMNKDNNDEDKKELQSENDNNHNIILKNKIICLDEDCIAIRSLSLELKISILMSGESNFFFLHDVKNQDLMNALLFVV